MHSPIVWINLKDYTPLEFFFYGLGCLLWVLAYAIYIREIIRLKYVEMPFFAGCCDVGWEFTWSFFAVNNMGMLFQGANYVWLVLDIGFIFTFGIVRYGWKQTTIPELRKRSTYIPFCILTAAFAAAATYFMHVQGLDNGVGGRSAFLIQLAISGLYIPLMLRQPDLKNFNYAANWLRSLGSALVVVFFFLHYPDDKFLLLIGTASAVTDGTFLYLYWVKRQELRRRAGAQAVVPSVASLPSLSPRPASSSPA
jgi:hypothetical protein